VYINYFPPSQNVLPVKMNKMRQGIDTARQSQSGHSFGGLGSSLS